MGAQIVLSIIAAWFVGSVLLGAAVGRMLKGNPPVVSTGLVRHHSRSLAA